ncbi:hypothetical protein JIN85_13855 [Luteolibacter pohnpeiensis]|uniref:Uncharacterized protein n=1 Tax=Luteolibacter pohnpeiensis TaxID=454153 RepID=A0A934VVF4_9BACT|nr:hypothetical protein [Luteolibacter pohnpeiensis]MBK1883507.1 hypothetical protein [Luteolibacter pohnpeiensis]
MKITLPLSLLILIIACCIGWPLQQKLTAAQQTRDRLKSTAVNQSTAPGFRSSRSPRERANLQAIADDAIQRHQNRRTSRYFGILVDDADLEFMDQLARLNTAELLELIDHLQSISDPGFDISELVMLAVQALKERDPLATLTLLIEKSEVLNGNPMRTALLGSALGAICDSDPDAALAWFDQHESDLLPATADGVKSLIMRSVSLKNPALAFELLDRFNINPSGDPVREILFQKRTPEQQLAALDAFRNYTQSIADEDLRSNTFNSGFTNLSVIISGDGFDAASAWVGQADLNPEERELFAQSAAWVPKSTEEASQWMNWIEQNFDPETTDRIVASRIQKWASFEAEAAGKWITNTDEGPVKTAAIQSFLNTTTGTNLTYATEWALNLTTPDSRNLALETIHNQLQEMDPAAAATFAEEHGLQP